MKKPTVFIVNQTIRLSMLKRERDIVSKGNVCSEGTPVMAIHDIRIEQLESFLRLNK